VCVRRTLIKFVWVLGCLVALASPVALAPRAMAASSAQVRLISAGKAPRSTLRMAVTEGTVAEATMQTSESITQSVSGRQINSVVTPPFTVGVRVLAGAVSPTGNTPISYGYANVTVVNDGSLDDAQLARFQAALAPLTSLSGTGVLTPRNQVLDSKVSGTEGLDPSVAKLVSQFSDQLGALSAPFPREAVGLGARWSATSLLHLSGLEVRQVTAYTVRRHEGSQVVVDIKVTQDAPRQRAELPGVPKGTKVVMTKSKVSGSGTATLSLVQPGLPLASEMHVSGTQLFDVSSQGQRGTLVQKITTDVKVSH
jgi:hypothetical protein